MSDPFHLENGNNNNNKTDDNDDDDDDDVIIVSDFPNYENVPILSNIKSETRRYSDSSSENFHEFVDAQENINSSDGIELNNQSSDSSFHDNNLKIQDHERSKGTTESRLIVPKQEPPVQYNQLILRNDVLNHQDDVDPSSKDKFNNIQLSQKDNTTTTSHHHQLTIEESTMIIPQIDYSKPIEYKFQDAKDYFTDVYHIASLGNKSRNDMRQKFVYLSKDDGGQTTLVERLYYLIQAGDEIEKEVTDDFDKKRKFSQFVERKTKIDKLRTDSYIRKEQKRQRIWSYKRSIEEKNGEEHRVNHGKQKNNNDDDNTYIQKDQFIPQRREENLKFQDEKKLITTTLNEQNLLVLGQTDIPLDVEIQEKPENMGTPQDEVEKLGQTANELIKDQAADKLKKGLTMDGVQNLGQTRGEIQKNQAPYEIQKMNQTTDVTQKDQAKDGMQKLDKTTNLIQKDQTTDIKQTDQAKDEIRKSDQTTIQQYQAIEIEKQDHNTNVKDQVKDGIRKLNRIIDVMRNDQTRDEIQKINKTLIKDQSIETVQRQENVENNISTPATKDFIIKSRTHPETNRSIVSTITTPQNNSQKDGGKTPKPSLETATVISSNTTLSNNEARKTLVEMAQRNPLNQIVDFNLLHSTNTRKLISAPPIYEFDNDIDKSNTPQNKTETAISKLQIEQKTLLGTHDKETPEIPSALLYKLATDLGYMRARIKERKLHVSELALNRLVEGCGKSYGHADNQLHHSNSTISVSDLLLNQYEIVINKTQVTKIRERILQHQKQLAKYIKHLKTENIKAVKYYELCLQQTELVESLIISNNEQSLREKMNKSTTRNRLVAELKQLSNLFTNDKVDDRKKRLETISHYNKLIEELKAKLTKDFFLVEQHENNIKSLQKHKYEVNFEEEMNRRVEVEMQQFYTIQTQRYRNTQLKEDYNTKRENRLFQKATALLQRGSDLTRDQPVNMLLMLPFQHHTDKRSLLLNFNNNNNNNNNNQKSISNTSIDPRVIRKLELQRKREARETAKNVPLLEPDGKNFLEQLGTNPLPPPPLPPLPPPPTEEHIVQHISEVHAENKQQSLSLKAGLSKNSEKHSSSHQVISSITPKEKESSSAPQNVSSLQQQTMECAIPLVTTQPETLSHANPTLTMVHLNNSREKLSIIPIHDSKAPVIQKKDVKSEFPLNMPLNTISQGNPTQRNSNKTKTLTGNSLDPRQSLSGISVDNIPLSTLSTQNVNIKKNTSATHDSVRTTKHAAGQKDLYSVGSNSKNDLGMLVQPMGKIQSQSTEPNVFGDSDEQMICTTCSKIFQDYVSLADHYTKSH